MNYTIITHIQHQEGLDRHGYCSTFIQGGFSVRAFRNNQRQEFIDSWGRLVFQNATGEFDNLVICIDGIPSSMLSGEEARIYERLEQEAGKIAQHLLILKQQEDTKRKAAFELLQQQKKQHREKLDHEVELALFESLKLKLGK